MDVSPREIIALERPELAITWNFAIYHLELCNLSFGYMN